MASCSSNLSYNEAIQKNVSRVEDPDQHDDARFVVDAASYNLLATQMAEEATTSGYSASLVSLAKENLEQHEALGKELKRVARKEKFVLPGKMSDDHQKLLDELKRSERRNFDRTYIRILGEISEKDKELFSEMATAGKSEEVRGFAAKQLGVFDSHKSKLETVGAELLRTY